MRKQIKVVCIICNKQYKTDEICAKVNDHWCQSCIELENKRSLKQDRIGSFQYSRPPKYAISKSDWKSFGY